MLRLGYLAGALALTASASCAFAQSYGTVELVSSAAKPAPVVSGVVTLVGNVHPLATPEFEAGVLSADTKLDRMMLVLSPSATQQSALDALVAAQQDPQSPLYHRWLTPAEYGARFGVGAEQMAQVTTWLARQGFSVEEISAGNRLVVFSGMAGQVSDSFHTEMRRYVVRGETHIANAQDPQIPAELSGVVRGIVSLHDFRRTAAIGPVRSLTGNASLQSATNTTGQSQPLYSAGSTHYIFPADFDAIYDLTPLLSAGTTGAGVSIAAVGRSNIELSDVAMFRSMAGLPAKTPSVVLPEGNPGLVQGDQMESTLDVEWNGATAPQASVTLVAVPSTGTTDGVDLAAEYVVNHDLAQVVSVSYGTCESAMGATELAFYNALWEQAAAQGMSVFVASGDAGAAGCAAADASAGSGEAVNGLCSSPYSTCVGGTELNDVSSDWAAGNSASYGSARGYIPEIVWNESALDGGSELWATGGGRSTVYAQPAWQAEVSGGAQADGMRAVPDVALSAANHDGAVMVEDGSLSIVSGTSVATASFAGIMALVTQKMGTGQGNANPELYALAGAGQNPFHTTPAGNNSVPGVEGFTASGTAYNLSTGLGSVDGAVLADDWAASAAPASLTLTAATDSVALVEGDSASIALTAATAGPFQGNIGFSVSGLPAGVTAWWSANPLAASGGSEMLTLSSTVGTVSSSSNITVTASGDGLVSAETIALTLQPVCPRLGLVRMRCALPSRRAVLLH